MKKHRIFNKGDIVYCLLSSYNKPNALIPVRGAIKDSQWDPINPKYKIQIFKFYDTMKYLKKYFFDMNFKKDFDKRKKPLPIPLDKDSYSNLMDLQKELRIKNNKKYFVIVDSLMCTKTRNELCDLFEKVQFYLISKNLKQVKESVNRPFFKGPLKTNSPFEFDKRFKIGWNDKFKESDIDIDKYLDSLS